MIYSATWMLYKIETTRRFEKLYRKLPETIKHKAKRQISLLHNNFQHPSLNARKMVNQSGVWEARIDVHYRMTFNLKGDVITLRAVGTHKIYRKP